MSIAVENRIFTLETRVRTLETRLEEFNKSIQALQAAEAARQLEAVKPNAVKK
jgi:uncharacterized coiled-coil protein SlyX